MTIAKMLNLGSGRTKFPGPRPDHHSLVFENIYAYPEWLNISKNASEEPDCVMDLFTYPWDLPSDTFERALLAHLCEHIPHEINITVPNDELKKYAGSSKGAIDKHFARYRELAAMQDGWYAFFSELHRVLKPGAMVHILSPHGFSIGGLHDPSHTRYLLPETFEHSMKPDKDAPFSYENGHIHFEMRDYRPGVTPYFAHLIPTAEDTPEAAMAKFKELENAAATRVNAIAEFYVQLQAVK